MGRHRRSGPGAGGAPRAAPAALVVALLLVVPAALLAGCDGGGGGGGGGDDLSAEVRAEIDVEPGPGSGILAAASGVWVVASTSFDDPGGRPVEHAVVRIDPATDEVAAVVPVPHQMVALAAGHGAIWAVGTASVDEPAGTVVRIDPGTGEIAAEIPVDDVPASLADVAVGHGAVWVADSVSDRVLRIDPDTDEVAVEIAIEGTPSSLAVTDRSVWVNKPRTGQIRPIDPATNRPGPAITTGAFPDILESGGAGLWVARYSESDLLEIDTGAGTIRRTVDFPSSPSRFAVGEQAVVVAETEGERLSAVRNGRRSTLLEGRPLVGVALDGDTAWVVDQGVRRVLRVALPAALSSPP